jgi:hypothetical protein
MGSGNGSWENNGYSAWKKINNAQSKNQGEKFQYKKCFKILNYKNAFSFHIKLISTAKCARITAKYFVLWRIH